MHLHRCSPGEREGGTLSHPLLSPFGHPSPRRRALLLPPPQPRPHRTCQVTNLRPPTPALLGRPGLPLLDWPRVRWSASNRQPSCATSPRSSRPAGLAGAQRLCDWCSRRSLSTQRAVSDRRAGPAQVPWHGTAAVGKGAVAPRRRRREASRA